MSQNEEVEMDEEEDQLQNQKDQSEVHLNEFKDEDVLTRDPDYYNYKESACSMKEGSIQGGVFALSSLALGTGAFSLPVRCAQIGCFWYSLAIIFGAIIAYWTLSKLIESSRVIKGKEYSTTVKIIIGKVPSIIVDIILMLYSFGVIIQFNVIIYSLIGRTIYYYFYDKKYEIYNKFEEGLWQTNYYYKCSIMFGLTFLIFPVCLLKDISKMRFASMFGICALSYSILVVVIETPWFFSKEELSKANWFNISNGFKVDDYNVLEFFNAMATVFFIFSCHPGAFPVFKSLKYNFPKRINTVFRRSIILDLIIYLLVAICGFITNPIKPPDLIVYRNAEKVFSNDIFMNIAKISIALDLYLSIPANYNSLRASFFLLFFKTDTIDNCRNIIVTLPILLIGTFIGVIFNDILSYISLLGGFCCSIICLLVPCILMVKTSKQEIFSPRNIFRIFILGTLCLIGFTAGILTIIGMKIKKKDNEN